MYIYLTIDIILYSVINVYNIIINNIKNELLFIVTVIYRNVIGEVFRLLTRFRIPNVQT